MHISEGVLSAPVLVSAAALAAAGVWFGLRRLEPERMMPVALFASAFFVASFLRVPIGPASAHLILNGLMGVALGWTAFPAIFTALVLQAFLFQYGGLTALGANTVIMAGPAVLCAWLLRPLLRAGRTRLAASFACGALSIAGAGVLAALALALSGEELTAAAWALLAAHAPVALIEGVVTCVVVGFVGKVRPECLNLAPRRA